MAKLVPFNDHVLIELPSSQWTTADETGEHDDPKAGYGTVIGLPPTTSWLSSYTYIFEHSLFNHDMQLELQDIMKNLLNKRVYFEKRADIGNVIEDGDKKLAVIKLTKITAIEDTNGK